MTIEFHCEHCGKKIKAPAKAGGKRGKCPSCHNSIYVPEEHLEQEEELKLAPLDENVEKNRAELIAETFSLTQNILDEKNLPDIPPEEAPSNVQEPFIPTMDLEPMDPKELRDTIIRYMRWMAAGQEQDAQNLVEVIASAPQEAITILDEIALSEIPDDELAHIQPHMISGFVRTLRGHLG